jgi:hypothetical protein
MRGRGKMSRKSGKDKGGTMRDRGNKKKKK